MSISLKFLPDALQSAVLAGYGVVLQFDVVFGQLADDHRVLGQVKDLRARRRPCILIYIPFVLQAPFHQVADGRCARPCPAKSTWWTSREIGMSMASFPASRWTALVVSTPSATMGVDFSTIGQRSRPGRSSCPAENCATGVPKQVSIRSPMPPSPQKVSGLGSQADAQAGYLHVGPGDQRRRGVETVAQAVDHARGDGHDVLQRTGRPPARAGRRSGRCAGPSMKNASGSSRAALRCREAATTAVGCRLASSRAKEGPGQGEPLPRDLRTEYLAGHLGDGFQRIGFETLGQIDQDVVCGRTPLSGAASPQRMNFEGTARTRTSARPASSSRSAQASRFVGQLDAGQKNRVLPGRIDGRRRPLFP